ncbi:molybdate ABC transporter permease subunit [Tepidibacillus fermentans]|uniref:Molybdenum transport system permease n=1 Tax=Tepidibacillus fermentans TaxID=1281767 RepID=A0A4V2USX8_9BACI|nr:molybdate ABC transporter permease subunit [Tepidibacillus fermentans]TCS83151.1 molybdate transport system permease protein [Tepidibacillus fermentans]
MFDQTFLQPFFLSFKIASIATLIDFIVGTIMARILSIRQFPGKSIVESIILLPLILPPTVVGFGLLWLFGKKGLIGEFLDQVLHIQLVFTWWGAVLAAIVVAFPLMYQSAQAAFYRVDPKLEQAAKILGASNWKVFLTITLPLAWPGLLAGIILTFARALGEFGATLMFAGFIPGKTETIPLAIYFAVERGDMKLAGLWVIIMVLVGFSSVLWLNWWSRKKMNLS